MGKKVHNVGKAASVTRNGRLKMRRFAGTFFLAAVFNQLILLMSAFNHLSKIDSKLMLGLKLRTVRQNKGLKLLDLSALSGISVSYLTEIEKGKKNPKPDKVLKLAAALQVSPEELTSSQADVQNIPASVLFDAPFFREFPFALFGVNKGKFVELLSEQDVKLELLLRLTGLLNAKYNSLTRDINTFALNLECESKDYYLEEIENASEAFAISNQLNSIETLSIEHLQEILVSRYGYSIENIAFSERSGINNLQSIFVPETRPRLCISTLVSQEDRRFLLAKEIGFNVLKLKRPLSFPFETDSYELVKNNFLAEYFAAALLINKDLLVPQLQLLFNNRIFDGQALTEIVRNYQISPERFLQRLAGILPRYFDFHQLAVLNATNVLGSDDITTSLTMLSRDADALQKAQATGRARLRFEKLLQKPPVKPEFLVSRLINQVTNGEYLEIACVIPSTRHLLNDLLYVNIKLTDTAKRKIKFLNDLSINPESLDSTPQQSESLEIKSGMFEQFMELK
jgi:XRE family transcriptional regulator, fatty acid utilization regulator